VINGGESVVIVKISCHGSNRLHTPQKDCLATYSTFWMINFSDGHNFLHFFPKGF